MQIVTRFAPSPTGRLHLGHAFSAVTAHDFARERDGAFLLRIEDIDAGRSRPEFVDGIIEDMLWLGLEWDDEIIYQSERLALYGEALDRLKAEGLVYPCICTRADIAASASAPHCEEGPIYPGTCRGMAVDLSRPHAWRLDMAKALSFPGPSTACKAGAQDKLEPQAQGRGPGAKLGLDPGLRRGTLTWTNDDAEISADPAQFGDVVLARKDAPASYHLAVVVDDAAQGVTDVVRGRDLFAATHVHRLLQALLDLPAPHYHHHPLLTDEDGKRLAKRHGAPTLAALRTQGADPAKLVADLRAGRQWDS